jgi:hypothetical protein
MDLALNVIVYGVDGEKINELVLTKSRTYGRGLLTTANSKTSPLKQIEIMTGTNALWCNTSCRKPMRAPANMKIKEETNGKRHAAMA